MYQEFDRFIANGLEILSNPLFNFQELSNESKAQSFELMGVMMKVLNNVFYNENEDMEKLSETKSDASPLYQQIAKSPDNFPNTEPIAHDITVSLNSDKSQTQNVRQDYGNKLLKSGDSMDMVMHDDSPNNLLTKNDNSPTRLEEEKSADITEDSYSIVYNFSNHRKILYAHQEYSQQDQFLKQVQFSPDGSRLLSNCEDNILRIYSLEGIQDEEPKQMSPFLSFPHGDCVYDFKWYPYSNILNPGSSVFITTSKNQPIKLWDAEYGNIRAIYSPQTQHKELIHALSVSFNLDGSKIYAGFRDFIRVFDTQTPGTDFMEYPLTIINDPVRRKELRPVHYQDQMPGFVSCIAFAPDNSGIFACGSYEKSVGIYTEDNVDLVLKLETSGGVTDIKFSRSGQYVYAGCRKDEWVYCWDIRNTSEEVYKYKRDCPTSQRLYFDLDPTDQFLAVGNVDHTVSIYNVNEPNMPLQVIKGHKDVVSSVHFHPYLPVLAAAIGTRRFIVQEELSDSSSDDEEYENGIVLWKL